MYAIFHAVYMLLLLSFMLNKYDDDK